MRSILNALAGERMNKIGVVAVGVFVAGVAMGSTVNAAKPASGLKVVLREYNRIFVLAPGETGNVTSVCLPGETVLSGSPSSVPPNVTLTYSSLAYDGANSGWTVAKSASAPLNFSTVISPRIRMTQGLTK